MIVLSGDIGGTNTRLRLAKMNEKFQLDEVLCIKKYKGADFSSLAEVLKVFIVESGIEVTSIKSACIAVAGPVKNGEVELTNLPWIVTEEQMKEVLQIEKVKLINDFESIGFGISTLNKEDIYTLQEGDLRSESPISYIGAGTGLGVGICYESNGQTHVFPTEAGHVDFAPVGDDQTALLEFLRKKLRRVSLERVCCGTGLVNIYKYALSNPLPGQNESPEMHLAMYNSKDLGATIAEYAFKHNDPLALRVIDIFIKVYGSSAGNLALSTLPYGGLYIVGGIAPKMLDQLKDGRFMSMFRDKGRLSSLLHNIPVYVSLNPDIGLQGAEQYAFNMNK
ncbi:glucokinase [Paraphotobacterium marinum]|uniref:Glucokinase n=1 Tax=Paraphotobacterium marinum TaxID=1755811 RepID=A0A220VE92_9GAMM|nr:glucokinase [Paraphotobacterium marinum]ASK78677.1 glucokinase [Paraphotobacterium marinum]